MLRPGALADVVVLSGDLEAVPAAEIARLHAAATICGGRVTYRKAS